MGIQIRLAGADDFAITETIERRSDELLIKYLRATEWPPVARAEERARTLGFTLLATDADSGEPVGFVQVTEGDEDAHLEQLSVLPERGRRGYGGRLVEAAAEEARRRGRAAMILRTFADVPWNAPFYAKHQFLESVPTTGFQQALVGIEDRLGLMVYGRRIQMTRQLSPSIR